MCEGRNHISLVDELLRVEFFVLQRGGAVINGGWVALTVGAEVESG